MCFLQGQSCGQKYCSVCYRYKLLQASHPSLLPRLIQPHSRCLSYLLSSRLLQLSLFFLLPFYCTASTDSAAGFSGVSSFFTAAFFCLAGFTPIAGSSSKQTLFFQGKNICSCVSP